MPLGSSVSLCIAAKVGIGVSIVEATDPVATRPCVEVLLPAHALQKTITNSLVRDIRDNRLGLPFAGNLVQDVACARERFVRTCVSAANVVERQKTRHAKWLVIVQLTDVARQPAVSGLPPDLSNRHCTDRQSSLDPIQTSVTHHDSAAPPTTDFARVFTESSDRIDAKHGLRCLLEGVMVSALAAAAFLNCRIDRRQFPTKTLYNADRNDDD